MALSPRLPPTGIWVTSKALSKWSLVQLSRGSILLLGVWRTKGGVTGPHSGGRELWAVAGVQFPRWLLVLVTRAVCTEQVGGMQSVRQPTPSQDRAKEEPCPWVELGRPLDLASSHVHCARAPGCGAPVGGIQPVGHSSSPGMGPHPLHKGHPF